MIEGVGTTTWRARRRGCSPGQSMDRPGKSLGPLIRRGHSHPQSQERRSWATALEESGRFDLDGLSVHLTTDLVWRGVGVVGGIGRDSLSSRERTKTEKMAKTD